MSDDRSPLDDELPDDLERQLRGVGALPSAARQRALDDLCARHPQHADALEALAALVDLGASDAPPRTVVRVGDFAILRLIGEGGMGRVYLGRRADDGITAAVKVIRPHLDTDEILRRFQREAAVLRGLQHEAIARFLDSGEAILELADGSTSQAPYLAMEYVEGSNLLAFAGEHELDARDRIRLFARVCAGFAHAHGRGVVHRDIKPGNIFVVDDDDVGRPKILDFGIARAADLHDDSLSLTHSGQAGLLGTAPYMSPEQIVGGSKGIDTRSDVYSLGVVLFELIAGRLPYVFRSQSLPEIARVIHDVEPTRLGAVDPRFRGGTIETILGTALEKVPERRYASAIEFLADLERHLRGEVITARAPSLAYRLARLARRHRVAAVAAVLALTALIVGTIGTTIGMLEASREARATKAALVEARELSDFLIGIFEIADPDRTRDMTARELLQQGAEALRTRLADQPLARARMLNTIGEIQVKLAMYDSAEPLLAEARQLRETHLGPEHLDFAESLVQEGILAWHRNRLGDAGEKFERALTIQENAAEAPDSRIASTLHNLGAVKAVLGDFGAAEAFFRRALDISEASLGPDSDQVAKNLTALGDCKRARGDLAGAESLMLRALAIRQRQHADGPRVATVLLNLGDVYADLGRLTDAEAAYRRALGIWEGTHGPDHPRVGDTASRLAGLYCQQQRFAEAESMYRRALAIAERSGADLPSVADRLNSLGLLFWSLERYDEAGALFERALAIQEKTLEPESVQLGFTLNNLGLVCWKTGRFAEAETLLRRTIALWEAKMDPDNRNMAWPLWGLAGVCRDQQRFTEAEPLYERALAIRKRTLPEGHRELRDVRADYAALLRSTGRDERAAAIERPGS